MYIHYSKIYGSEENENKLTLIPPEIQTWVTLRFALFSSRQFSECT